MYIVLTGVGNKTTFLHIAGMCVFQKNNCMHRPCPKPLVSMWADDLDDRFRKGLYSLWTKTTTRVALCRGANISTKGYLYFVRYLHSVVNDFLRTLRCNDRLYPTYL